VLRADIVASRVNLRKVDFAIICSEGLSRQHGSDWFYGDSFRLRQALVNLCDNGIKFSKEEGGEVTVRIDCKQEDGAEEFSFVITDNGAGIDPEKQYLLFKPFSQVWIAL
jgi:signal transduction histidine kinase